jgi:hypothetical protein
MCTRAQRLQSFPLMRFFMHAKYGCRPSTVDDNDISVLAMTPNSLIAGRCGVVLAPAMQTFASSKYQQR